MGRIALNGKRLTPALILLLLSAGGAGCVVRSAPVRAHYVTPPPANTPPPPPPPVVVFNYIGGHPVPVALGGGWDATPGFHAHNYGPDPIGGYRQEGPNWRWIGDTSGRGGRNGTGTPPPPHGGGTSTSREGTGTPPPANPGGNSNGRNGRGGRGTGKQGNERRGEDRQATHADQRANGTAHVATLTHALYARP